ncbi:hypothetical protein [Tautonia plasticadhaerens]|uniref:Uncharacterized protein n=1 Tax=Tautonia plasticadhaerens TaxID=2527974 RepID=A0A518GUJ2_9BACT|nr:hypothetical protein [Tautonia plasticadhaerens]QDV32257.1 hypothetical protein ElP_00800 [Tautonia plasticadhaerens]
MTLIKIGGTYLNMELVTEIRDTGVDVEIFFNTQKATTLRGAEAETFRRWLDSTAFDPLSEFGDGE